MKDITTLPIYDSYETHDEARVVEIYHFWNSVSEQFYNSSDTTITYNDNDYLPAAIRRDRIEYNSDLNSTTVKITGGSLTDPVIQYISSNPVEQYWVSIRRMHRSISSYVPLIFYGLIKNITFKGTAAEVECVGTEYLLETRIPRERYQADCNNTLYDERCGLTASSYKLDTTVSGISSNKLTINVSDSLTTGAYKYGWAETSEFKVLITDNTTNAISIRIPIPNLAVSDSITIYQGCDKKRDTCMNKFNNYSNFFGFPWIPTKNPALRIT